MMLFLIDKKKDLKINQNIGFKWRIIRSGLEPMIVEFDPSTCESYSSHFSLRQIISIHIPRAKSNKIVKITAKGLINFWELLNICNSSFQIRGCMYLWEQGLLKNSLRQETYHLITRQIKRYYQAFIAL